MLVEVQHITCGEIQTLPLIEVEQDKGAPSLVRLEFGFSEGPAGMHFDPRTGGGMRHDSQWMITDAGMLALGLERAEFPKAYLDHREMIAAGRGEVALPEPQTRTRRVKPDSAEARTLPLFGKS